MVTATLSEHDTRTAPASITVDTREELETRNAADLLDAVRGTPGITLSPRQVGGRKTIALRGLEGKHTLTLIDGCRISPSDDVVGHSDYQYGWLPISAVERVEIIRGAMSTLYGSEALGGVVNLITRQPKDRWIGSAMLSGSDVMSGDGGDGHRASLFAAGPAGESLSLRFNTETANKSAVPEKEDRRYSELEGSKANSGGLGATLKLSDRQSIDANWNDGSEERFYNDVTTSGVIRQYENRYYIKRSQGSLAWRGEFDGWRSQIRAYRSEIDIANTRTSGVAATRPQNISDAVVDGFAAIKLGDHLLTAGGEFREETLQNSGLIGGKDDATHKALFVQDEFILGDKLSLTAGLRADNHEIFGTEASPRAYLVWEATSELVVKGGYQVTKALAISAAAELARYDFPAGTLAFARPEKRGYLTLAWDRGPWDIFARATWTAPQDLRKFYYRDGQRYNLDGSKKPDKSPVFWTIDARVQYAIDQRWAVFAGVDNLTDFRQSDHDSYLWVSADGSLDVTQIWGLNRGRFTDGGARFEF